MDCHTSQTLPIAETGGSIALVGHQNVGKSVLFTRLTGRQTITANYPGTTVEIARGQARSLPGYAIVDTPGVLSLPPATEDEQATERVLFHEPLSAIVQVGDAKNLRRTLLLTVQLAEMGRPFVLALNMVDEARERGVQIDYDRLASQIQAPVVPLIATQGQGVEELTDVLATLHGIPAPFPIQYPAEIESAVKEISPRLPDAPIAGRALALLWLAGDPILAEWLQERLRCQEIQELASIREAAQLAFVEPLSSIVLKARLEAVEGLSAASLVHSGQGWRGLTARVSHLTTHPFWGLPFLAAVLYALYWFVGVFGAGTLVDLLESGLFAGRLNPWLAELAARWMPIPILLDFLFGEYGLWTMGMTYALALILPIVSTFFLAFGFLEDSGYLARLSVLSNRLFRLIGLNGKAVVPMILGLGCVTMATLTTRILETRRERLLTILLLALAVPCSAQLGVIMGMLAGTSMTATLIWGAAVMGVLVAVGWLSSRLIPGERSSLMVELPPMRKPVLSNVLVKTLARLEWYLKEVIPLFLLGAAVMFTLDRLGLLEGLIQTTQPLVVDWLGLPPEASAAFLMGFLRRDFGATGLFVLESQGLLTPVQIVVAMITVTLFIPCVASVFMIARERSTRTAIAITAVIFPLAFMIGGLVNRLLLFLGWGAV